MLNSGQAAALLQIHPKTLQKLARAGTVLAIESETSGASVRPNWTLGCAAG
jgi:hypothetical protein